MIGCYGEKVITLANLRQPETDQGAMQIKGSREFESAHFRNCIRRYYLLRNLDRRKLIGHGLAKP
jgi:hypothetical protein